MLTLKPASWEDMPFRQSMLQNPETMAYNAPWYPPDGTVPFPESEWAAWLDQWANHEPEHFCGFLQAEDGTLVGEVSWHHGGRGMGVVIDAPYRGRGYGLEGLALLAERAFRHGGINELVNDFESDRAPALATHLRAGFTPLAEKDGILTLRLTRERWEARRRERLLRLLMDAMCDYDAGDARRIHHFVKVHGLARQIGQAEGLDENTLFTLEAAAITHDIGIRLAEKRYGRCDGKLQEELGPGEAEPMLAQLGFPRPVVRRVGCLIGHHHTTADVAGVDWQILLEADFLVNMVEEGLSAEAIDAAEEKLFRTAEGKRLLRWLAPRKNVAAVEEK